MTDVVLHYISDCSGYVYVSFVLYPLEFFVAEKNQTSDPP